MNDNLKALLDQGKKQAQLIAGVYRCKVVEAHPHRSQSLTPGYRVKFEVVDGTAAGATIEEVYWLTARALNGFAIRQLQALGLTEDDKLNAPQTIDGEFLVEITIADRTESVAQITRVS